jgi:transcriptional antiterminator RfaH
MWCAAIVRPNQTHIALSNLKRQSYNSFSPIYETKKLLGSRLVRVNELLFPGYVFVELADGQRWPPINSTWGIQRLITHQSDNDEYQAPSIVPDSFIERLMSCSYCETDTKGNQEWRLLPGTKVRITQGPFQAFEGVVTSWSGADRCRMLVWLLNRNTEVEVYAGDLAVVS